MLPNFSIEDSLKGIVVGIDEAGRGPLAGPVVAAAVIIQDPSKLIGVNDSKKLTKLTREKLFVEIQSCCVCSIGIATVNEIEDINILQATMLAMRRAVNSLTAAFDYVIIDGKQSPVPNQANYIPIIRGDSKSLSIASASIVAKVSRDKMMDDLHGEFPDYGWNNNAGYGTAFHINSIKKFGLTLHHRKSFLKNIITS
jgi:ribonuclease HII